MAKRYALYFTPGSGPLAELGANWLGWDPVEGNLRPAAPIAGLPPSTVDHLTTTPRNYGFHGTLKAPFRLRKDQSATNLVEALEKFAENRHPIHLPSMSVRTIGSFVALVPSEPSEDLNQFAARVVEEFDDFRARSTEAELARRRKAGLTKRQDEHLVEWGYPFLFDEFRFHMTLSNKLERDAAVDLSERLQEYFEPVLPTPFPIDAITLLVEGDDGFFRQSRRFPLLGPYQTNS